jgi:phosphopantothenoylcysteine synthetase/decarboxylase
MHLLITAGNTWMPIDRVRVLTNIFTGRTGALLAQEAHARGHHVLLLTSQEEIARAYQPAAAPERWRVRPYRTFEELETLLRTCLVEEPVDAILHSAAVSDFRVAGSYVPGEGTYFEPATGCWQANRPPARLQEVHADKLSSQLPELWLRLLPAPKLVDRLRRDWGFTGVLVKFKLEVGLSEAELLARAERSRQQSAADLMVANTLEESASWAYLGPLAGEYRRLPRRQLAPALLEAVEACQRSRKHG